MAGLTIKANFNLGFLKGLAKAFPLATYGVLSQIGHDGRRLMKASLLEGQVITLHKYPKDKGGKNTINWKILPGIKGVRITSYPLNLYNPRKQYRRFSPTLGAKLDTIVSDYEKKEFQKIVNQADK
jgi:hypothetical protein